MKKTINLLIILVIYLCKVSAQDSTFKDVFPLSKGNNWFYNYNYERSMSGNLWSTGGSDKGFVLYSVLDSLNFIDSTKWKIKIIWNITVHNYSYDYFEGNTDTTYTDLDSTISELIELKANQHHIYFANDSSRYTVWRLPNMFWDSIKVFRYQMVDEDSNSIVIGRKWVPMGAMPCSTKFKRNVGIVGLSIDYTPFIFPGSGSLSCTLKTSTITSTEKILSNNFTKNYLRISNYPNPFNPATTIIFQLPNQEHVSLKIFDMLGREVTTLVDDIKSAGIHQVEFNAAGYASGVYFYQVKAGSFVETKKFVLMK